MKDGEQTVADEGNVEEEEHHDRLMALLHDLVRKHGGRSGAARVLRIDRRTVATCMDEERLTRRMRKALERVLREKARSASDPPKPNDALDRRVEALEKDLDTVRGEVGELREGRARRGESLERRSARGEAQQGNRQEPLGPTEAPSATGPVPEEAAATGRPSPKAGYPKRLYPELVTRDPAPDDRQVYGEAWPLIEEWRSLWKTHSAGGRGLAWLEVEERVRELEVAMLEEHGLTLPPETVPLTGLWRSTQLNWRKDTLRDVRRAVEWRLLVKRIRTLGRGGHRRFGGSA